MTAAFKARILREIAAYRRYMTQDAAVRRVKRNYLGRLDVQIDTVLKEYTHNVD